jgi:hypothetical protein
MTSVTSYDWDRKKRTPLRSVRPGDYFCFALPSGGFGAGMVISRVSIGHAVEIFDARVAEPRWSDEWREYPIAFREIIDSYSLFDRKKEGDWRIVASSVLEDRDTDRATWFAYGSPGDRVKVNLLGERSPCSEEEYDALPRYRPAGEKTVLAQFDSAPGRGSVTA